MVWIKIDDSTIINFENVFKVTWAYREDIILEFYMSCNDHQFLIYNKKIFEDLEKLGSKKQEDFVNKHLPEMIEVEKPRTGILLPHEKGSYYQPIIKNAIASDYLNRIFSCLLDEKNSTRIINFYKEFGTKKER
jgi:hypothetical protein